MSALRRFLPVAILLPDRLVLGESGHRNFDAKPRAYKFVSGCLGSKAGVRINRPSSRGLEPVLRLEVGLRLTGDSTEVPAVSVAISL